MTSLLASLLRGFRRGFNFPLAQKPYQIFLAFMEKDNVAGKIGALSNGGWRDGISTLASSIVTGHPNYGMGWGYTMGSMFKTLGRGLEITVQFANTDYSNYGGE